VEWIVPVPLHWRRRRWRGFNQAEILARHLSESTRIPLKPNALRRVRATRMQVRLPAHRRAENVRGAFALRPGSYSSLPGIILVDDVVTGGHTVLECARVLRAGGAPEVWVAAFARAGRREVEMREIHPSQGCVTKARRP
jgi:ComF family protein